MLLIRMLFAVVEGVLGQTARGAIVRYRGTVPLLGCCTSFWPERL